MYVTVYCLNEDCEQPYEVYVDRECVTDGMPEVCDNCGKDYTAAEFAQMNDRAVDAAIKLAKNSR